MGTNRLLTDVPGMREGAGKMVAAKPVVQPWTVSPVKATMMGGVIGVSAAVTSSVQAAQGFGKTVADGFDLFSQITLLCANEYEQTDTVTASKIAHVAAATAEQSRKVDEVGRSNYFDYVRHYGNGSRTTDFTLPPDGWGN